MDVDMRGTEDAEAAKQRKDSLKEEVAQRLVALFKELPGHSGLESAYVKHRQGKLKVSGVLEREDFEETYKKTWDLFRRDRAREVQRRRRTKRNYARLNAGYTEEEAVYDPEEPEFQGEHRVKSMAEDYWKAEYYQRLCRDLEDFVPEREPRSAPRSDRLLDVFGAALRAHIAEQNRPTLTHELADFENPYMMKRSAAQRILQERCVRNQLDERCLPRLLDNQPDLVKLRAKAPMPPEVLEPLAAFRGDVRWHFDARERLLQKLRAADTALSALVSSAGDAAEVAQALPENAAADPAQVPGVHHPWRNHVGFESAVPRGVAGGTRFGRPEEALTAQISRLRYPTLQRVAHTLPADPKWRAHVAKSIEVLERSKQWDYASKLRAINSMKEVYDHLKPSHFYTSLLDEKLPINRVPSHLKKKYAPDADYVRTFPKKFIKKKTNTRYPLPLIKGSGK